MYREKITHNVVQQEIALDTYLSTLLEDIPDDIAEIPEQRPRTKTVVKPDHSELGQTAALNNKSVIEKGIEDKIQVPATKILNPLSVMPDWTQQEFQALFFRVDQLILATPLTELLRTIQIEKKPTPIPTQPSWFMGLLDTHEQRIGVLDTGQLVFGKTRGQRRNLKKNPFQKILITYDGRWGLACDEILSIGKLEPTKVRWRTMREKRPWLIGTVIEELTAVIDIRHLVPHKRT